MRPRALLVVPLVVAALGLPALHNGLCWDDLEFTFARGARLLSAGLTGDLLAEANPGQGPSGYYRPVAVATLAATERIRPGPAAHHAVSVALHALAAALFALLLSRRLGRSDPATASGAAPTAAALAAAVAGALLWALHPANLEPVAWISARYDLLTGLLAVAILLLPWRAGPGHAALLGLLLLAGLLSKEGFVAVAAVVVVDDLASGRSVRVAWPRWLAAGLAVASWLALRRALSVPAIALPPLVDLPRDLLAGLATWLGRALWPWPLTVSHPYLPTWPLAAVGGVALGALLRLGWRRRALATPVALLIAPLVPMAIAAARLGEAPERYLLLPSLGLAWLATAGLHALWTRGGTRRAVPAVAAAGVLAAFGATWWTRLPDWRDDATLFGAALRVDPGDALGQLTLGSLAVREGRLDEAARRLTAALARDPRSVRALNALAVVHLRRGEVPSALARARQAVALAPSWPQARLQLSGALHLSGDHGGELQAAEAARALSPAWREARLTCAFARCEVTPDPGCEADLDALEREGGLSPVDALVARTEAAIRRRDPVAARERVERLVAAAPGDPRLRQLVPAVARLERPPP
jgi:protein O-mannosyl-transferase